MEFCVVPGGVEAMLVWQNLHSARWLRDQRHQWPSAGQEFGKTKRVVPQHVRQVVVASTRANGAYLAQVRG
eukprot:9915322-Lingulodinium_polyedra.AAC.1